MSTTTTMTKGAPRRSTSLSLDRALLDEARAMGVTLSRAAEAGIAAELRRARAHAWQQTHRAAIEDYNAIIAQGGVPLAERRKF